jgi:hypothetical protein
MSRKTRWGVYLLLTFIPSVLYIGPLAKGVIPWFMDTSMYFFPLRWHAAQLLHQGDLPLWNRCIMGGMPLFENPQAALAYPFHWPFLAWPGGFWFTFPMTLQLGLYGALTAWALRRMGVSDWPAIWCGCIALAGGYGWSRLQYGNYMNVLPWWPLWLGSAFAFVHTRKSRWLAAGSIAVAMMLLSGAHQLAAYGLAGLAFFSLVQAFSDRCWLNYLAVTVLFGCLIGSPGWLPQLFFIAETSRAGSLESGRVLQGAVGHAGELLTALLGNWSLAGLKPPETIQGPWADAESSAAVGLAALVLALIIPPDRRARIRWWGCILVAALAVALSLKSVMSEVLKIFPVAGVFHAPRRILGLGQWSLILAMGLGVSGVLDQMKERTRKKVERQAGSGLLQRVYIFIPAVIVFVSIVIMLSFPAMRTRVHPGDIKPGYLVIQVLVALACLAGCMSVSCRLMNTLRPLALTCALILTGHLTWVTLDTKSIPSRSLTHPAEAPLIMQAGLKSGERFFTIDWKRDMSYDYTRPDLLDWMLPNLPMLYGLEDMGGYEPAQSERYRKYILWLHIKCSPYTSSSWNRDGSNIKPFFHHFGYIKRGMQKGYLNGANIRHSIMPRWGIGTAFYSPTQSKSPPYLIWPMDADHYEGDAKVVIPFINERNQIINGYFGSFEADHTPNPPHHRIDVDPARNIQKMNQDHDLVAERWPNIPRKPSPVEGFMDVVKVSLSEEFNRFHQGDLRPFGLQVNEPIRILDFYVWNEYLEKLWKPVAIEELAALMRYTPDDSPEERQGPTWIRSSGDNPKVIHKTIEANKLKIEVEVGDKPIGLIIADAWWPGWRTLIDGQSAECKPAGLWRRIEVPPGRHTIEMIYLPTAVWTSLVLGLFSCFVLLVTCLIRHRSGEKGQQPVAPEAEPDPI